MCIHGAKDQKTCRVCLKKAQNGDKRTQKEISHDLSLVRNKQLSSRRLVASALKHLDLANRRLQQLSEITDNH